MEVDIGGGVIDGFGFGFLIIQKVAWLMWVGSLNLVVSFGEIRFF